MATLHRRPIRAVIYCRISLATHGDRTKVDRQEKLCRRVAKRMGWEVVRVYCDNNKSAWQRNRKRDDWDAMLAAIERGEADAVIVYHGDRLIRQPWDLETLLSLADGKGIRLASPSGTHNLDDSDDRYRLRQDVAAACRESDRISERTRVAHLDRAERGVKKRRGGHRPFGYKRSGKIREEEAEHYRDAVARILAGESMRSVIRDWNQRGVTTTPGNAWTNRTLKLVLRNPRYAGLSTYKGEVVGKGKWEALVEREPWEALQATLDAIGDRYSALNNSTTSKYLLTYIAFHRVCGSTMRMHHNGDQQSIGYVCSDPDCPARVRRNMRSVDEYVIGVVLQRLADPRLWAVLDADQADDGAVAELAALQKKRQGAKDRFTSSITMTAEELDGVLSKLDRQIEAVRERIAARAKVHVLHGCRDMTREQWDALPVDRRRALVRATVTVELLRGKRGRYFDPETVRVEEVPVGVSS